MFSWRGSTWRKEKYLSVKIWISGQESASYVLRSVEIFRVPAVKTRVHGLFFTDLWKDILYVSDIEQLELTKAACRIHFINDSSDPVHVLIWQSYKLNPWIKSQN